MLNKIFSVAGIVGINLALAFALTATYLLGLIPHVPAVLLWVVGVCLFGFASVVSTFVLSLFLAGESLLVTLMGRLRLSVVFGAVTGAVLIDSVVWALLGRVAGMHGFELGYVLTVFGAYIFTVVSFVLSGFSFVGGVARDVLKDLNKK
ncbi:MAG TPA: hypothetical protein V6C81_21620 [Planktothrix sp.]|jgi:hypothetical protein